MRLNNIKLSGIVLLTLLALSSCKNVVENNYIVVDGFAQGGTYHVVYEKPSSDFNLNIKDSLDLYFQQINKSVNGYDSLSLISKFNRGEDIELDFIFKDILCDSYKVYLESNGYFDVSAAPLFDIWGFGFKNKEDITQHKLDSILTFVGLNKIKIENNRIIKQDPRINLNFNAIAQGYTCDYIGGQLMAMGIKNFLVEVGGEVLCKGVNANGELWRVGIDKPIDGNFLPGQSVEAIITLSNKGLVTSGNYRKYYIENGEKYSHTLDPKTGYPVKHNLLSVTVLAETSALADAYATYFMVIGLDEAKKIIENNPDIEALFVYGDNDEMFVYSTPGITTLK